MRTTFRRLGIAVVLLALIGFMTIADDLRHTGELFGVGSVLLAGIALIAAGFETRFSRHFAFQWLAVGLMAGGVFGAAIDNMLLAVSAGGAICLFVSYVVRRKYT